MNKTLLNEFLNLARLGSIENDILKIHSEADLRSMEIFMFLVVDKIRHMVYDTNMVEEVRNDLDTKIKELFFDK